MKREEVPVLMGRLSELADYYGVKVPSQAAVRIWLDCLEGLQWDDVANVLTDWPKSKRSFPTGDEVRKLAAARVSDRVEAEAKRNRETAGTVEGVLTKAADSPNGRAFKRMWRAWRSKKVSSPAEWCRNVMASDKADAELKAYASASLEEMKRLKCKGVA